MHTGRCKYTSFTTTVINKHTLIYNKEPALTFTTQTRRAGISI